MRRFCGLLLIGILLLASVFWAQKPSPSPTSGGAAVATASGPLALSAGNITCATCATSAASLAPAAIVTGSGFQALKTADSNTTLDTLGNLVVGRTITVTNAGASSAAIDVQNGGGVRVSAGSFFFWFGSSTIGDSSNGVILLADSARTDFNRLQAGGTTSAYPSWQRSGAGWIARLADNSADTTARVSKVTTETNCSSSASPAVCSSASAGSVVVAASATTVVVNTTAVTANSQIFVMYDSSLGTKLSVTCNATEPALYGVTARTAATSFTLTATAPVTNPACFSYAIWN